MAPPRKAAAKRRAQAHDTNSDNEGDTITSPQYNGDPATFATYHNHLIDWLPTVDPSYRSLVEYSAAINRQQTCFQTTNHIHRYRQGLLTKGNFRTPCRVTTVDFDATAAANALDPGTATAPEIAAESRTMSRYAEFPEFIDSKDKAMGDEIAATFIHRTTRKKWHSEQAKGSGLAFLVLLEAYRTKLDADCRTGIGENVVLDIQRTIADGFDEASCPAFSRFDSALTDLLDTLPIALRAAWPESVLARHYIHATNQLGINLENKLEHEMDRSHAGNDLGKVKEAIESVLARHTARNRPDDREAGGRGLAVQKQTDARRSLPPKRVPGGGGGAPRDNKDPDRPWEWRAWTQADGPCGHCEHLSKDLNQAKHWRKDCKFRDEAIASRKAAKEAKNAKKPRHGRANLASGGKNDSDSSISSEDSDLESEDDDDCDSCDEDHQASSELFKPGTSSLLDVGDITDSSALLAALTSKVGQTAAKPDTIVEEPPLSDSSSTTAGPPPLEATGAPSAAEPAPPPTLNRALMVTSTDASARAGRFYVVCYGDGAGIYHGTWHAPDNVRSFAEGVKRAGNNPTHIGFDALHTAVEWCQSHSVSTVFRGPRIPAAGVPSNQATFQSHILRVGTDLLTGLPALVDPDYSSDSSIEERPAVPRFDALVEAAAALAADKQRQRDADALLVSKRVAELAAARLAADQEQAALALAKTVQDAADLVAARHAADLQAARLVAAEAVRVEAVRVRGGAEAARRPQHIVADAVDSALAPFRSPEHPLRVELNTQLTSLYYHSDAEMISNPPGPVNRGKKDEFTVDATNQSVRGQIGKWCLWVRDHCGQHGGWTRFPIKAGSLELRSSLVSTRGCLMTMLSTLPSEVTEDAKIYYLVTLLADDLARCRATTKSPLYIDSQTSDAARCAANPTATMLSQTPKWNRAVRDIAVDNRSAIDVGAGRFGSFARTAYRGACAALWLVAQAALAGAAVVVMTSYLHDPGTPPADSFRSIARGASLISLVALSPLALCLIFLWLVSLTQANCRGAAGGVASAAGRSPWGPTGNNSHRARSLLQHRKLVTDRTASTASMLASAHGRRALAGAGVLCAPSVTAAAIGTLVYLALLATFATGSRLLNSSVPPSSSLSSSAAPGGSFGPGRTHARTGGWSLGRHIARVTGGTARLIRSMPCRSVALTARIAHLVLIVTTVLCFGHHVDPPQADPVPHAYRAACELGPASVVFSFPTSAAGQTARADQAVSPHRRARAMPPRTELPARHHGRALTVKAEDSRHTHLNLTGPTLKALLNRHTLVSTSGLLRLIVDSGCTMHCHPIESDLINRRRTKETMSGIDGKCKAVKCIGDLPVAAIDRHGKLQKILIKNVRCVPSFTESLISVDRLFEESGAEARFANHRHITAPSKNGRRRVTLPFQRESNGLFVWSVAALRRSDQGTSPRAKSSAKSTTRALKTIGGKKSLDIHEDGEFHRARSTGHLKSLSAENLAAQLHLSLHLSPKVMSRLSILTRDVPSKLSQHSGSHCVHCLTANATHSSHSSNDVYRPSYAGRLVHADIVGPFKQSAIGSFKYALVLVDDHTRHKFVYFLRRKSEALRRVRSFVADLNSHLNRGRSEPIKIVGSLHTDNAGEFLSREFKEFMDSSAIRQTTCPPYVHSLNGVAERAIRSIMENTRAHLVASHCPLGFWPHAVEHAVDVLNRTTGPTGYRQSSHELLEGVKPRVLSILPFGCRAVAVKPRVAYSKTNIESHGVEGINLGRASSVTNGYRVWVPSQGDCLDYQRSLF